MSCGTVARYHRPLRIKSVEFVLKFHATRSPKTAGRKFYFHPPPARTHHDLSVNSHGLVIDPHRLQPDGRVVADSGAIRLEVDGSLHHGEPQFAIGR